MPQNNGKFKWGSWNKHTSTMVIEARQPTSQTKTTITRYLDPTLETDIPDAISDATVPYLIGRYRITRPNTIWTGIPVTTKTVVTESVPKKPFFEAIGGTSSGKGGPGTVHTSTLRPEPFPPNPDEPPTETVTITSTVSFALGLCLGPDVEMLAAYNGDEGKVSGQVSPSEDFAGMAGYADSVKFYSGSWSQDVNPTILAAEGAPRTPAYRGTAYVVVTNGKLTTDNILMSLSFELQRHVDPLGLGDNNTSIDGDIAVPTALHDLLTNPWGGIGISPDWLNLDSFVAAAGVLYDEYNFCTVHIPSPASVKSVLAGLFDQISGALRWNPGTKKLDLVLFRDDWDIDAIPVFNVDNLSGVDGFAKDTWYFMPQAYQLAFSARADRYKQTTAIAGMTRASADMANRVVAETFSTICDPYVATVVADQQFARLATPLAHGDMQANRDAAQVLPGDVVRLDYPDLGLIGFPVRVINTKEKGTLLDTFTVGVEQARLPFKTGLYLPPVNLAGPNTELLERPDDMQATPVPLYIARKAEGGLRTIGGLGVDDNFVVFLFSAMGGSNSIAVDWYDFDNGIVYDLTDSGTQAPIATLDTAIAKADGYESGVIASVTVTIVNNPDGLTSNQSFGTGEGLLMIGNEILYYDDSTDNGDGTFELIDVRRGLIDSVAAAHSIGATVTFINNYGNVSQYMQDGSVADYDLEARGIVGVNESNDYASFTAVPSQRARLPAAPHNAMALGIPGGNSVPRPVSGQTLAHGDDYYISWRERNRLSTALVGRDDPTQTMTETTTYTLTLKVGAYSAVLATGISGDETLVTIPSGATLGLGVIEIVAVTSNGTSAFAEFINVEIL